MNPSSSKDHWTFVRLDDRIMITYHIFYRNNVWINVVKKRNNNVLIFCVCISNLSRERERESVDVCVGVCEREREREREVFSGL